MLRRIVGGVALAAVLATGASAQTVPVQFQVASCSGVNVFNDACGSSASIGSYNGLQGQFSSGPTFQIWCVDETDQITPGIPTGFYNAFATSLNGPFTNVYKPAGAPLNYTEAAVLTQEMSGTDDFIDPSNPATAHGATTWGGNPQIQFAIWTLMGYDPTGHSGYNAADVAHWTAFAAANTASIDPNDWVIISDALGAGHGEQEFLAQVSFPEEVPTPEPGTMAMLAVGLVGMAGAGFRRRRK
ncbi:MAG TPA: PEP-CTERM sorting domain-containing protein [Gemmatimonadales bacterium]|jgi:hypothetical protein